jgi:aromatic ring-opening dioxygenase LigB subunit
MLNAVLMCHAPIVIPQVAGGRAKDCVRSTAGMSKAARCIVDKKPELLVMVSPHTPRLEGAFGLVRTTLNGDFARFGAQEVRIAQKTHQAAGHTLFEQARSQGIALEWIEPADLDHGAAVPFYFLQEAGWHGENLLFSLPRRPQLDECIEWGRILAGSLEQLDLGWSFIASGDMSHCLQEGAPAGFHSDGRRFDAFFKEAIGRGDFNRAIFGSKEWRTNAAEDVVESVAVAFGAFEKARKDALGKNSLGQPEIYSYEGPFGVGYLNALLFEAPSPCSQ